MRAATVLPSSFRACHVDRAFEGMEGLEVCLHTRKSPGIATHKMMSDLFLDIPGCSDRTTLIGLKGIFLKENPTFSH